MFTVLIWGVLLTHWLVVSRMMRKLEIKYKRVSFATFRVS